MSNQFILTPYFLDQAVPGLPSLAQTDWHLNHADLQEGDQQSRMSVLHTRLAQFVMDNLAEKRRPVSIAGDCCSAIGVMAGLQQAGYQPLLIWFDAHGDFNTRATTPSGFLGGMPLAMLTGRGEQGLLKAVGLQPIPEKDVILSDGRDLDPGEACALQVSKIVHVPDINQLHSYGLGTRPLYIHFDTDIIDPEEAPAMNYPTSNGPTVKEIKALFHSLARSGHIIAISLSSWNPDLDKNGKTQERCLQLLQELCSHAG